MSNSDVFKQSFGAYKMKPESMINDHLYLYKTHNIIYICIYIYIYIHMYVLLELRFSSKEKKLTQVALFK